MADKSLSTTAKHIKVITVNGLVTLRGPVNNPSEWDRLWPKPRTWRGRTT